MKDDNELLAFTFIGIIGIMAMFVGAFQIGWGLGGTHGYNTALDEVAIYGFEAVNARWDRNKPGFVVRDKELKPATNN